ncbi:hypothetical protein ABZ318_19105 [Streptomyces sp. NPDC006197]|uniref:competence protein CoiA family protein n=1 Tax=Streptomyces sp. NPDC006197 TaxID=3156685 RepID=UPI0033BE6861
MFVRRQRRAGRVVWVAAHLPLTHAATPEESDKHKAMKERIARSAFCHGLDVQVEARSSDGRIVTDVLMSGAGGRVGWEAQYSPISASRVRRRSGRARENGIAPLWVTGDASSEIIDRAPWTRVDDVPWQRIVSPLAMIVRGGVRHLQIWKCTASSERSCPETGSHCGKFHSGWFLPALCVPQERATALDELVVTSADGEHVAVRVRNTQDPRRASYLWALAEDVQRWRDLTDHGEGEPEDLPADDEPVTYTEEELDSSCRYGNQDRRYFSDPRPRRDLMSATGPHTFDTAPDQPYRAPQPAGADAPPVHPRARGHRRRTGLPGMGDRAVHALRGADPPLRPVEWPRLRQLQGHNPEQVTGHRRGRRPVPTAPRSATPACRLTSLEHAFGAAVPSTIDSRSIASSRVPHPDSSRCLPSASRKRIEYGWGQRVGFVQPQSLKKDPMPRASCRAMYAPSVPAQEPAQAPLCRSQVGKRGHVRDAC